MKWRLLNYKIFSAILIASAVLVFFGSNIIRFVLAVATNNYYRTTTICDDQDRSCASITYESHSSLNSEIKKYFFIGGGLHIPFFNNNYVMFEDGSEFCFKKIDENKYEIYSNILPKINNINKKVKVYRLDLSASGCNSKTY